MSETKADLGAWLAQLGAAVLCKAEGHRPLSDLAMEIYTNATPLDLVLMSGAILRHAKVDHDAKMQLMRALIKEFTLIEKRRQRSTAAPSSN